MAKPLQKTKIVKLFASSEYGIRNRAFKAVKSLLKLQFGEDKKQLSGTDVLAIWKGLYVWLWMQDKPILHEEVVEKICSLLPHIECEQLALEFVRCFFVTMNREWPKIDKHRIDKYFMLVRDMLATTLRWQASRQWSEVESCTRFLIEEAMTPARNTGLGLQMHLVDILIDELLKITDTDVTATTHLVSEMLLTLPKIDKQQLLVNKIQSRVVSRLQPLCAAGKLQIDLLKIGAMLLHRANNFAMRVRTRKMFFSIYNQFHGRKASSAILNTDEKTVSVETGDVEMAQGDVEMNEGVPEGTTEASQVCEAVEKPECDDEEDPESDAEEDPESDAEEEPKTANGDDDDTAQQSAEATNPTMETEVPSSESAQSEQDRRVTFGKRYTKKFKRSSTSIPISVGTVKQSEIKSILKRVSTPMKKSR